VEASRSREFRIVPEWQILASGEQGKMNAATAALE
jgi:hypothetical protein